MHLNKFPSLITNILGVTFMRRLDYNYSNFRPIPLLSAHIITKAPCAIRGFYGTYIDQQQQTQNYAYIRGYDKV